MIFKWRLCWRGLVLAANPGISMLSTPRVLAAEHGGEDSGSKLGVGQVVDEGVEDGGSLGEQGWDESEEWGHGSGAVEDGPEAENGIRCPGDQKAMIKMKDIWKDKMFK
ncbi:hypothetical protein CEXT_356851 [Caerostris extrusa]|uniref:Uncharacterized protein n=1 Tax=Caerostris extrusa TaxID=172846 RepID=A0AAV4P573_CAEEX|nr:hypothetical protein CEXT_356851 [Caerostris extrusa]